MKLLRRILAVPAVLAAVFAAVPPLRAAEPVIPGQVVLDLELDLDFTPNAAHFVVRFDDGSAARIEGLLHPVAQRDGAEQARWRAGAVAQVPPAAASVRWYAVVFGGEREHHFAGPHTMGLRDEKLYRGRLANLKDHLGQRKAVLESWNMQVEEQAASVKRLRTDAEVIGQFQRILDAQDDLTRAERAREQVERDIKILEEFLRTARTLPAPRNMAARERQLSKHVAELAEAAKRAESSEPARRSESERAMQRKLSVIESTRTEDVPALEAELLRLRKQRGELEAALAPTAASPGT